MEEEDFFQDPLPLPDRNRARLHKVIEELADPRDGVEASLCTLCQQPWTNLGQHAIVNMKCGHLFGKFCIERYIRDSPKFSTVRCPVCDAPILKSDPRRIFPEKVTPCDESVLIALRNQIKESDDELLVLIEQTMSVKQQIDHVKFDLDTKISKDMLQEMVSLSQKVEEVSREKKKFTLTSSMSFPNEKYDVMDLIADQDMVIISVSNGATFGIRKLNVLDPALTEYIPIHHQIIKDLKQSSHNTVLSTGLDKTLKLTSLSTNQVVQSYDLKAQGWSCATDVNNPNLIYCGLTLNTVSIFDIRNTKESVQTLKEPDSKTFSPVHSICSVGNMVICSNLNYVYGWSLEQDGSYKHHVFEQSTTTDTAEKYTSFHVTYQDGRLLTSMRNKNSTRYEMARLESNQLDVEWYCDQPNYEQKSLVRNSHFERDNQIFVCYSNHDSAKIRTNQEEIQSIKAKGPVIDIRHMASNDKELLAVLTKDELCLYKFQ